MPFGALQDASECKCSDVFGRPARIAARPPSATQFARKKIKNLVTLITLLIPPIGYLFCAGTLDSQKGFA
jgi:hypothetical protein